MYARSFVRSFARPGEGSSIETTTRSVAACTFHGQLACPRFYFILFILSLLFSLGASKGRSHRHTRVPRASVVIVSIERKTRIHIYIYILRTYSLDAIYPTASPCSLSLSLHSFYLHLVLVFANVNGTWRTTCTASRMSACGQSQVERKCSKEKGGKGAMQKKSRRRRPTEGEGKKDGAIVQSPSGDLILRAQSSMFVWLFLFWYFFCHRGF